MGYNLLSCCHKCKLQEYHLRNEEHLTILPFYKKHSECAKENINNVITIMDNNGYFPKWANDPDSGGYQYDEFNK
jgi:hypothetical protein